jgi:cytochrome c oxidase subunit 1
MYKGSISLKTPMLHALSFLILFTIGGVTGVALGVLGVSVHLHDTYFVVAHFHYVMMGGTVVALLGGMHYWWPKITGKMYLETPGRVSAVLVFIGFNLTFFTQLIMGAQGMPRRYYDYPEQYTTMHVLSTIGSWVLASGLFLCLFTFIHSLMRGKRAPANPWGGASLEWTHAASPPLPHNFEEQPIVTHGPYDYHDFYGGDGHDAAALAPAESRV